MGVDVNVALNLYLLSIAYLCVQCTIEAAILDRALAIDDPYLHICIPISIFKRTLKMFKRNKKTVPIVCGSNTVKTSLHFASFVPAAPMFAR